MGAGTNQHKQAGTGADEDKRGQMGGDEHGQAGTCTHEQERAGAGISTVKLGQARMSTDEHNEHNRVGTKGGVNKHWGVLMSVNRCEGSAGGMDGYRGVQTSIGGSANEREQVTAGATATGAAALTAGAGAIGLLHGPLPLFHSLLLYFW